MAKQIADWLSSFAKAMYSASTVERATVASFSLLQLIAAPLS